MHFFSFDRTRLAYRRAGTGSPLVCIAGGPLLSADYLGDLGGLGEHAGLILLDHRGSGASNVPSDLATYRCDRIAEDVEALRLHLGLERLSLLGHSAGANVVYRYAEAHPGRVEGLVLVAPSTRAVGIEITDAARTEVAGSRAAEPWYPAATAALARIQAGTAGEDDWAAIAPFSHGRWDAEIAAYDARMDAERDAVATRIFASADAFDPPTTRAALAELDAPVLVLAGGADVGNPIGAMSEVAELFPHGEVALQEGAGHFPWVDDPATFRSLVAGWLARVAADGPAARPARG